MMDNRNGVPAAALRGLIGCAVGGAAGRALGFLVADTQSDALGMGAIIFVLIGGYMLAGAGVGAALGSALGRRAFAAAAVGFLVFPLAGLFSILFGRTFLPQGTTLGAIVGASLGALLAGRQGALLLAITGAVGGTLAGPVQYLLQPLIEPVGQAGSPMLGMVAFVLQSLPTDVFIGAGLGGALAFASKPKMAG